MAKVSLTLDDVVLALKKGKRTVADETATLNIPAQMSSTGKRRLLRLDVSEEGRSLLSAAEESRDKVLHDAKQKYEEGMAKLQAEREKAEATAWQDLNRIADKVEEMRPRRGRSSRNEETTEDEAAEQQVEQQPAYQQEPQQTQPEAYSPPAQTHQYDAGQAQQSTQWN